MNIIKSKINNKLLRTKKGRVVAVIALGIMLFATVMSVVMTSPPQIATMANSNNLVQLAAAQTSTTNNTATTSTTAIDTFNAKGMIDSMASDVLAGRPTSPLNQSAMWILGGNWNFGVMKGNLQDFKVNITMVMLDGKGFHTHSIDKLSNVLGIATPSSTPTPTISLTGNYTAFKGIADINTNGKLKWKDVPVTVHIINGNILNLAMDERKTEDHFKGLPVFGTVTSLTDQNNNELRTGS